MPHFKSFNVSLKCLLLLLVLLLLPLLAVRGSSRGKLDQEPKIIIIIIVVG